MPKLSCMAAQKYRGGRITITIPSRPFSHHVGLTSNLGNVARKQVPHAPHAFANTIERTWHPFASHTASMIVEHLVSDTVHTHWVARHHH